MEIERPKLWQSLRTKIPLSFIAGALLIWLIANTSTTLIEYFTLQSAVKQTEFYDSARIFDSKLVENKNNPDIQTLLLSQMTERIKEEHRRKAPFLHFALERYDFSEREFVLLTLTDNAGKPLQSVSGRLTGEPQAVELKNFSESEKKLVESVRLDRQERNGTAENGAAILAMPLTVNSEFHGILFINTRVPFSLGQLAKKIVLDFVYDLKDVWMFLVIFGLIFGVMQANQVMKELDEIARAVKSWSNGDFTDKAYLPQSDELGLLAYRLNKMAGDISEIFEMRQTLAAADERARIARDLHDSVKQQVFSLSLQIGAAQKLFNRDNEKVFERIEEAQKLAAQVQQELVELISELRSTGEKKNKFEDRLKNYLADWSRQYGIVYEFEANGSSLLIPSVEHSLFRIFQEVLANIARHSRASQIQVSVNNLSTNSIEVKISDNGIGFDQKKIKKGFGLQNMKERTDALENGFLIVTSNPGQGTKIEFGVCKN